ncbi:unnamed protein product [Chrysoparadoxa australica]
MEARNNREAAWSSRRKGGDDDDSEDEEDEDALDEQAMEQMRAMRVAEEQEAVAAKPKGVSGIIETQNPNAISKANKMKKVKNLDADAAPVELTRREREAVEAQARKDHYEKLHKEGKTDEAKSDLARLAEVKARREAALAKKLKAEEAAKDAEDKVKAAAGKDDKDSGFPVFSAIEIKKMNPAKLKEVLKERGESTQGSKKDLQTRLLGCQG